MSGGWGATNVSSNAPSWHSVFAGSNANGAAMFANVTPGAFAGDAGIAVGVFAVDVATTQALRRGLSPGWNMVRQWTGPITTLAVANDGAAYGNLSVAIISNGTSNAFYQVTVNSIGHVQTVTLVNSVGSALPFGGGGYTNTGMLGIGLPANALFQANISSVGIGYSNSDSVAFSNGVVNAFANVSTNSIGAITSLTFTSTGSGFDAVAGHVVVTLTTVASTNTFTSMHIVGGGTGFTNGDIAIGSNGVTNASATVGTNTTGGITSLTMASIGSGFDGNASHVAFSFTNSTGGTTAGTNGNLSANAFGPFGGTIVANSTSFKVGAGLVLTPTLGGRAGRASAEVLAVFAGNMTGNTTIPTL